MRSDERPVAPNVLVVGPQSFRKFARAYRQQTIMRRVDTRAKAMARALKNIFDRYARVVAREEARSFLRGTFRKAAEDDAKFLSDILRVIESYGIQQVNDAGQRTADELGAEWETSPKAIMRAFWDKDVRIQNLASDTREAVREDVRQILFDSQQEDPTPSAGEVARRIRTQFYGGEEEPFVFSSERASLIARTELAQAENTGIFTGYQAAGITELEWIAATDGRSGDRHHERMNGKRVALGGYFRTPLGNMLRYPGDPFAPVKETANCRCTTSPVVT